MPESHETQVFRQGEVIGVSVRSIRSLYPDPAVVDAFEKHYRGAAKEILEMTKIEQAHLHELDRAKSARLTIGMAAGIVLCLVFILSGVFLIYTNHPVGGASTIILGLLMIVNNLVTGGKQQIKQVAQ